MIFIESGIEIPKAKKTQNFNEFRAALEKMKPGQSFKTKISHASCCMTISDWRKSLPNKNKRFTTRTVKNGEIRVWRIK